MIVIEEITDAEGFKKFIAFPYALYQDESNWVPPLLISQKTLFDRNKNPFWHNCDSAFFIARENGKVVGRIAAILHHDFFKSPPVGTGFFGFLEGCNDQRIFEELLGRAECWLISKGCNKIVGPVNPSINYEIGVLVEGYKYKPSIMMTYNSDYYPRYISAAGYDKEMDFFAYHTGSTVPLSSEKLDRVAALTKKKYQIRIRPVRKKDFYGELRILHAIYNDAFSPHYGFIPMSIDEFIYMGKDLRQIVVEEFLLIAELGDEPIGFIMALPDYNEVFARIRNGRLFPFGWIRFFLHRKKIINTRVMTIAVKQRFVHLGIGAHLYSELIARGKKKNRIEVEMSWVAENNVQMNKAAREMGAIVNKKYRLYSKAL